MAEVARRGVIVGWGATCGRHVNDAEDPDDHTQCKKQLTFGKSRKLTEEQCKIGLKRWLLLGLFVEPSDQERTDHVNMCARKEARLPLAPGEDLDAELQDLTDKGLI